jgi:lipid-A-disaccharide synthase
MRYFIIAGEASGDLHASHLMRELKIQDKDAQFCYFGGDLMAEQGGTLLKHYREMAFMGFTTVLLNIRTIKRNFRLAEKKLLEFNPDVLILVDYPGFNLPMAAFAKKNNIKTFYYISPKIWAWKTRRVKKVKKFIDEMFTIFPFESDFYKKYDYKVHYVGNPTVDELANRPEQVQTFKLFISENNLEEKKIIALLAGSRKQEIKLILPVFAEVAGRFPEYQFVIAGAPSLPIELYRNVLGKIHLPVIFGKTYSLLQQSSAALVTSGTATLETAVIKVPQVVCYRMELGFLAKYLKKLFLKTAWFSLVNLIMGEEIVQELFQEGCSADAIEKELRKIMENDIYRSEMIKNYELMLQKLGGPGCADRTAKEMVMLLKSN